MTRGLSERIPGEPGTRVYPHGRSLVVRGPSTATFVGGRAAGARGRSLRWFGERSSFSSRRCPSTRSFCPGFPDSSRRPRSRALFSLAAASGIRRLASVGPLPPCSGSRVTWRSSLSWACSSPRSSAANCWVRFLTMAQLVVFFWVGSSVLQDIRLARQSLFTFGAAAAGLAVGTLLQLPGFAVSNRTGEFSGATRTTALDFNPNTLASLMGLAAVMLIGTAARQHKASAREDLATLRHDRASSSGYGTEPAPEAG